MADYRDLLRRAVEALPENNGAARRQVYEKARKALYAQLRAIEPALPSREITQHRLHLEDCIREVEQQATEKLLGGFQALEEESPTAEGAQIATQDGDVAVLEREEVAAPPAETDEAGSEPERSDTDAHAEKVQLDAPVEEAALADESSSEEPPVDEPVGVGEADEELPVKEPAEDAENGEVEDRFAEDVAPEVPAIPIAPEPTGSRAAETIDDIIRQAEGAGEAPANPLEGERQDNRDATDRMAVEPAGDVPVPEAEKDADQAPAAEEVADKADISEQPAVASDEPAKIAPARDGGLTLDVTRETDSSPLSAHRAEPFLGTPKTDTAVSAATAMSAVREVEVDIPADRKSEGSEAQQAIDNAIALLDKEARGEEGEAPSDAAADMPVKDPLSADLKFARTEDLEEETGGGNALTIFLVLFLVLLAAVGGAGYWAWREGYLNLNGLLGQGQAETASTVTAPAGGTAGAGATGQTSPGNTASPANETPSATMDAGTNTAPETSGTSTQVETGPSATPNTSSAPTSNTVGTTVPATGINTTTPATEPNTGQIKSEARLSSNETSAAAADTTKTDQGTAPAADAATGNQALLLEASDSGGSGAVPYSGTVVWSRGTDEMGQPTLIANASIPARNMKVKLLIRKNSDPGLPASHLMEVDFNLTESFVGGGIGKLAGVLLKNKELVQGTPLVGASARVVGNSFLYALTADKKDVAKNEDLLKSDKWLDLALVYSTGKQAILTLEKSAAAQKLFDEVIAVWAKSPTAKTGG